ncbi:MAG: L,D-transpeptidase family protein, partial [Bacillus sp. (in: firmicutes)]
LDTPTPLGTWKVISKAKWGGGFGTRWMGLNVPWGTYGIHGTNRPDSIGNNASAGCIRMNNKDVEDLYKYVKHNTPVAIVNGLFGPFGYGLQTIYPGDIGADVMEVQSRLRAYGYYNVEYLDGEYGPHMEQALYEFQKDHNITKDPYIREETYKALGIVIMD